MQNETELDCQVTKENPFGCVELWAGNELAHRHVELVGLEGDLIAVPSDSKAGGDFYALFSCGADRAARIVLADSVGHGDRKSTRLNSSHGYISYAVFCLKKNSSCPTVATTTDATDVVTRAAS